MAVRRRGARERRRSLAGACALVATPALAVGAAACDPAPNPQVDASCTYYEIAGYPVLRYDLAVRDFPRNETFRWWGVLDTEINYPGADGFRQGTLTTGPTGAVSFGFGGSRFDPTAYVAVTVYRDLDGNLAWDPGTDQTIYRGSGTVTTCTAPVTLAPK
jgi:hypothetical protein